MQLEKNAVLVNARTESKWGFFIVQQIGRYRFDSVLNYNSSGTVCTDCHPISNVKFQFYRFCKKVRRTWSLFLVEAYVAALCGFPIHCATLSLLVLKEKVRLF